MIPWLCALALWLGWSMPPPNNSFASAILVSSYPYTYSEDWLDAVDHDDVDPSPTCAFDSGERHGGVWWKFTPSEDTTLYFSTVGTGPDGDTLMSLWRGTALESLVEEACSEDEAGYNGFLSQFSFTLTGGETYYLNVTSYYSLDVGNFPDGITLQLAVQEVGADKIFASEFWSGKVFVVDRHGAPKRNFDVPGFDANAVLMAEDGESLYISGAGDGSPGGNVYHVDLDGNDLGDGFAVVSATPLIVEAIRWYQGDLLVSSAAFVGGAQQALRRYTTGGSLVTTYTGLNTIRFDVQGDEVVYCVNGNQTGDVHGFVKRWNLSTNMAVSGDIDMGIGTLMGEPRILPSGNIIVAIQGLVSPEIDGDGYPGFEGYGGAVQLTSAGDEVEVYHHIFPPDPDGDGVDEFYGVALDPDGDTFWVTSKPQDPTVLVFGTSAMRFQISGGLLVDALIKSSVEESADSFYLAVLEDEDTEEVAITRGNPLEVWIELNHQAANGDPQTFVWSGHALPDRSVYHSGFKEKRLLTLGNIQRALSDDNGVYETTQYDVEFSDHDRLFRGWLLDLQQRQLLNVENAIYIINDLDRRAEREPFLAGRGVVSKYGLLAHRRGRLESSDLFSLTLNKNVFRRILGEQFAAVPFPETAKGQPQPIIYGSVRPPDTWDPPLTVSLGFVPTVDTGDDTAEGDTYRRLLVCGHAIKAIYQIYMIDGDGTEVDIGGELDGDLFVPGYGADAGNPTYRDYTDEFSQTHRVTVIFIRGDLYDQVVNEGRQIVLNVDGIEDAGDGTGELITDFFEQYQHFLLNWCFTSYFSGPWITTSPTWSDSTPKLDIDSFEAARAIWSTRLGSLLRGGWMLNEQTSVRDALAMLNRTGGCDLGISRHGTYFISVREIGDPDHTITSRQILDASLEHEPQVDQLYSAVPYSYGYDYALKKYWAFGEVLGNADDGVDLVVRPPGRLELRALFNDVAATWILHARILAAYYQVWHRQSPMILRFPLSIYDATALELGDRVLVVHPDTITPEGDLARVRRIELGLFGPSLIEAELLPESLDPATI